ncbi:Retrovirus-related Pol polyprotein from transposon 17.6, partial [Mucuna pruriens]
MDLALLNYTTTEKELLAIVFALDKFLSYLLGSKIILFSDHSALRFLLKKSDAKPGLIQSRLLLQEFNIEIKDKKGAENSVTFAIFFHQRHPNCIRRDSKVIPNTTYGMILTFGYFAMVKSYAGASWTPRSSRSLMSHKMYILSGPKKGTIEQLTSLKDDC